MARLIVLRSAHWWSIAASMIGLLVLIGIMTLPTWYAAYVVNHRGPELQRCFGFVASEVGTSSSGHEAPRVFAISAVSPDSPLAHAGVMPGDMLVGYQHGMALGFYSDLEAVLRGENVVFSVLAMADRDKGRAAWREIRLENAPVKCN